MKHENLLTEREELLTEIEDETHGIKGDICVLNCMIHQIEKIKKSTQERWDKMVLLKYKVEDLIKANNVQSINNTGRRLPFNSIK